MVDVVQPLVCSDPPQAACGGVLRSKRAKQSRLHVFHMVRCAVLAQVRVVVACALVHCFRHTSLAPGTFLAASQHHLVVMRLQCYMANLPQAEGELCLCPGSSSTLQILQFATLQLLRHLEDCTAQQPCTQYHAQCGWPNNQTPADVQPERNRQGSCDTRHRRKRDYHALWLAQSTAIRGCVGGLLHEVKYCCPA